MPIQFNQVDSGVQGGVEGVGGRLSMEHDDVACSSSVAGRSFAVAPPQWSPLLSNSPGWFSDLSHLRLTS